jgi:hypothetical protein
MKSISKMLERSDLSGKERIILRIHNDINEMKTGKSILSESDIYNLAEGWKPADNFQAREYNKYLNVWKSLRFVESDIQTIYLNAIIDINAVEKALLYFVLKDPREYKHFINEGSKDWDEQKVLNILLKNTGFNYENVLHKMTFDSLPKNIQKDLQKLDSESEYEPSYYRDEENLSRILKNKDSLNSNETEELIDTIMDTIIWEHEHEVMLNEKFMIRNLKHAYFADIPLKIFIDRMAKNLKITHKDEGELFNNLEKIEDFKNPFRQAVKDEISKGIFFSDYVPLCNSTDKATYSGIDTNIPHNELLDIWIKEKDKNRKLIQKHIDSGKLVLENRAKKIFSIETYDEIITGESIYNSNLDLPFVREYKSQIEQIMFFGDLIYLMNRRTFPGYYQNILAFQELLEKVSKIIESDITFMCDKYFKELNEEIDSLTHQIHLVVDKVTDLLYVENENRYYMEIYVDDMIIDRNKLKPKKYKGQEMYESEVSRDFGGSGKIFNESVTLEC